MGAIHQGGNQARAQCANVKRAGHPRTPRCARTRKNFWAPFTKGETKQGRSARTSKGLVTREHRAVHERGRTLGRHSPRVKPSKGAVRERQKGWSPAKTALCTNEEELLESGIEEGDLDERRRHLVQGCADPLMDRLTTRCARYARSAALKRIIRIRMSAATELP